MGRLAGRELSRAERRLETLCGALDWHGLTQDLAWRAGALAQTHALRGYDAVHLASAASLADDEFVFVAADGDLSAAARAIGLVTAPVL